MSLGMLWIVVGILMLVGVMAALSYPQRMKLSSRTGDADPPENPPEWDPGAADEDIPLTDMPDMQPRTHLHIPGDEYKPPNNPAP
jgi:hypothetical protein